MKLDQALAVLSQLPVSESQALDIQGLSRRVPGVSKRTLQRYMEALSGGGGGDLRRAPLVRRFEDPVATVDKQDDREGKPPGRAYRYCLDTSALRQWFMTDHMALNLLLADQVVGASLGASPRLGGAGLAAEAAQLIRQRAPEARRIGAYVRIVPDGVGRRPARIDPQVVDTVIEAIAQGRQVRFAYASARGHDREWEASPRGLVAKDGTLYLIATPDLSGAPITFALHRVRTAQVSPRPVPPQDFDIDRFLEDTQHLSHPLGPQAVVELKLRVAAETLYHFHERPLWSQTIGPPDAQGRVEVTARVPHGVLLTPFLLSMSPGVEVLAPAAVREEVAQRVLAAARHYAPPGGRAPGRPAARGR